MVKTVIFDGREFAETKEEALILKVLELRQKGVSPHLVSIIVGDNPASHLYVGLKKQAVERIGGDVTVVALNKNVTLEKVMETIDWYNNDTEIQGIMVQLPLPEQLLDSKFQILDSISPAKDVDGLRSDSKFTHPTAQAVMDIIDFANGYLDLTKTSNCVVVGASGMVGTSVAKELKKKGYNVTECDKDTVDLKSETLKADILVSATGQAGLITEDMIKSDATVIDVGSPVGNVDLDLKSKASFVTPVPGGVGPVTISCLLENLIEACDPQA
ncbi:MAG TPA: bifunctional 5,10-methylenetetrahydrofolate dehydrogenase/5,10-methenyltetrahydrofolate cyclohydrolase [Patescibacteria group bacterium]|nr:bifunctional 5,10-methylenetetrahydrofolate dehydrogenase/5,10-methenyltetrahydrofolate cyclohydrolase [Patescibacteria group bacterium]